ncbi:MAG: phage tail protein [Acidimicrobiia bacterium]
MSDSWNGALRSPAGGRFLFEVDGVEIGTFSEVSGLSVEVAVEPVEEGGQNQFIHKLPGRMEWPNVVLKRGITQSDELFQWLGRSSGEGYEREGSLTRNSAAITVLNGKGDRMRSWVVDNALPVRWNGPTFASSADACAEEELEIAHHGFRSQSP